MSLYRNTSDHSLQLITPQHITPEHLTTHLVTLHRATTHRRVLHALRHVQRGVQLGASAGQGGLLRCRHRVSAV